MPLTNPPSYTRDRTLDQLIPLLSPAVWFRFQDVGGTTVTDASGNARTGTAVPGTGTVTLAAGSATVTAGGRITIANNAAFSVPTRGGMTVWVLGFSTAGSYLVSKGGSGGAAFEWQMQRSAGVQANTFGSGGSTQSGVASVGFPTLSTTRPNTSAGIFWDTTNLSPHAVNGNGQHQKPTPTQTASSAPTNGASVVTLGSRVDQGTADFAGIFNQFAIFPYAMDPAGLLSLAQAARLSGFDVPLAV